MSVAKIEVQEMIKNLPDDCSYEDIQYHLYVVEKIERSLKRAKSGETSTNQDAKQRMKKWLES